jgi:hypothetical protein
MLEKTKLLKQIHGQSLADHKAMIRNHFISNGDELIYTDYRHSPHLIFQLFLAHSNE